MTKPAIRTAHDRDIDAFIESIRPEVMRDATHLRRIAEARDERDAADERLRAAVELARDAGDSWTMIGLALRTSKQNAFRKYGAAKREHPTP